MAIEKQSALILRGELLDEPPFMHYYDQHPPEDDLMGESVAQSKLIMYLVQVFEWLYHAEGWFVVSNLNIYRRKQRHEYPLAPDVAVFKGVVVANPAARTFRSWRLYEPDRPAPQIVFEVSSDTTWKADLNEQPEKYAALGVQEYFAYDPNDPAYFPPAHGRLRGWRLVDGARAELATDSQGWIWSVELESHLVPDGAFLRLYDRDSNLRLTRAEASEAAWAKLRELGIDPATL